MAQLSEEDAITRLRAAVEPANHDPGRAWRVRRLDHPGAIYYLVVLGDEREPAAVGTVNADSGDIGSVAKLPGLGPHLAVDAERAKELAGAAASAAVELVWRPSRVSKSPLYPVWEVALASGRLYVDQAGSVRSSPP